MKSYVLFLVTAAVATAQYTVIPYTVIDALNGKLTLMLTSIDPTTENCTPGFDRRINTAVKPSREWRCDSSSGGVGSWRLVLDTSGSGASSITLIEGVAAPPAAGQALYFDPITHHLSRRNVAGIAVDLESAAGLSVLGGGASSWPAGLPYYIGKGGGGPPENVIGNNNWVLGRVYCYDTYDPYILTPNSIIGFAGSYGNPTTIAIAVFDPSGTRLLSTNLARRGGGPDWARWSTAGTTLPPGSHSWCLAFEATPGVGLVALSTWSGNFSANSLDLSAGMNGAPMSLYSCSTGTVGSGATFAIPQFGNCPSGHGTRAHVDANSIGIPNIVAYQ